MRRTKSIARKAHLDVMVVIALEEEFSRFTQEPFFSTEPASMQIFPEVKAEKTASYNLNFFEFRDATGQHRKGCFARINDMGARTRDVVYDLLDRFEVSFWVSTGISAALANDVGSGDIVVAETLSTPIEKARAEPGVDGGISFRLAGDDVPLSNTLARSLYALWSGKEGEASRNRFQVNAKTRRTEIGARICREPGNGTEAVLAFLRQLSPQVRVGPTACGPILAASSSFKQDIQKANRKFLAYDMESAEVGGALAYRGYADRFMSIRTVSDHGDENKAAFEASTKNEIRSWAIRGLAEFLSFTLAHHFKYQVHKPATGSACSAAPTVAGRHRHRFPGGRIEAKVKDLALWDRRYRPLLMPGASPEFAETPITSLIARCAKVDANGHELALVVGPEGSGKSNILDLIKAQYPSALEISAAAALERWSNDPDEPTDIAARKYVENFLAEVGGAPIVLMDDLDLDCAPGLELLSTLKSALSQRSGSLIVAAAVDRAPDPYKVTGALSISVWLPLGCVAPGAPGYEAFIETFLPFVPDRLSLSASQISGRIAALGARLVDPQFVSLLINNWTDGSFSQCKNVIQFANASAARLASDQMEGALGADFVKRCASAAFAAYVDPHCHPQVDERMSKAFGRVLRSGQWLHEALVAEFVVNSLLECADTNEPFSEKSHQFNAVRRVYESRVSSLIKHKIAVVDSGRLISGVEKILAGLDVATLPLLIYVLGRISAEPWRRRANLVLKRLEEAARENFETWSNSIGDDRLVALARRAVFISKAYQNDREAAISYVHQINASNSDGALNRGFHVEYYGDREVRPSDGVQGYMLTEDEGTAWSKTFHFLSTSIQAEFDNHHLTPKGILELGTFCSFVADRLDRGELCPKSKDGIVRLFALAQKVQDTPIFLREICRTLAGLIEGRPDSGLLHLVRMVYQLKREPRAGWRRRTMGEKIGHPVETVASHIFGAALLVLWFLPETPKTEYLYSKAHVLELVLLHDIGESVVGDRTPEERMKFPVDDEEKAVNTIQALSVMPTLHGLASLTDKWNEFEHRSSHDGAIARDFDLLDALIQAILYRNAFATPDDFADFVNYHLDRITTPPGIAVLKQIGPIPID